MTRIQKKFYAKRRVKFPSWRIFLIPLIALGLGFSNSFAEVYEAPPYVPPPPPESKVHLTDNGDETITDGNGLMWTKKDSYADLGQCLNWYQSNEYVNNLMVGGYEDWRMPTILELYGIYDDTIENAMAFDHNPDHPLRLSRLFADGAAYWHWSGEREETKLTDCCASTFYYAKGISNVRRLTLCNNGGVRAVRNAE